MQLKKCRKLKKSGGTAENGSTAQDFHCLGQDRHMIDMPIRSFQLPLSPTYEQRGQDGIKLVVG